MEADKAGLAECSPVHVEFGWADYSEQDLLLRPVGWFDYQRKDHSKSHGADALRKERHLPLLRQLEQWKRYPADDWGKHADHCRGECDRRARYSGNRSERLRVYRGASVRKRFRTRNEHSDTPR